MALCLAMLRAVPSSTLSTSNTQVQVLNSTFSILLMWPVPWPGDAEALAVCIVSTSQSGLWRGAFIVFQVTGDRALTGDATGSECDPRISIHWQDNTLLWPCVRLAGKKTLQGIPRKIRRNRRSLTSITSPTSTLHGDADLRRSLVPFRD
jgi:hypothetical protein